MKTKHLITVSIFSITLAFNSAAKAGDFIKIGDVFYCESSLGVFFAEFTDWKIREWTKQRFKFKIIDVETIKFGDDGFMTGDHKIDKGGSWWPEFISAADLNSLFVLEKNGRFNYSHAGVGQVYSMTGKCDKF